MLTLVTSHSARDNTSHVVSAVRSDLAAGHHVLFVVPEQQTVSVEREMACLLPPSAPLSFEVVNFTRLADTVFRMHGGISRGGCTPAAEQLFMWRTLSELSPLLHTRIEPDPKNIAKMRSVVKELRAMRMTPAALRQAAASGTDDTKHALNDSLRNKLEDYALISATYHALLAEHAGDAADHLDRLADLLTRHPFSSDTRIYLDNFSSFTEQELGVIEALLPHSPVTITLCVPPNRALQLSGAEADGTIRALTRLCAQTQTELKEEALPVKCISDAARAYVADNLFRVDYASLPPITGAVSDACRLVEVSDPCDACDWIAADIQRRVREGARYQDFAVISGSSSSYVGILDASFEKSEIPFFFARRRDLLTLEPIKMILSAYAVVTGNWRREDVIAYLKCACLGISPEMRDELELYAETWNIHGARWYDGIPWNMSPFGYESIRTDGQRAYAAEKSAHVAEARERITTPLQMLGEMCRDRHTVTMHVRALTGFLLSLGLDDYLDARAEELRASDSVSADEYARLWDIICDTLDTMTDALADISVSAEEFAALLRMIFAGVKLGAIPATMDEVTVGDARMLRISGIKHAYLLGTNEGEFPPPPAPDNAFTEAERAGLIAAGVALADDTDSRAARELFSFWRAMSMAEDSVTVLWSRAGTSLESTMPSEPVTRIRHLLGTDYPVLYPTAEEIIRATATPAAATERMGRADGDAAGEALRIALGGYEELLRNVNALSEPLCNENRSLTPETARALCKGDLAMSQTKIEKFVQCPFAYFCTFVLKLDTPARAEFTTKSVGVFIHSVLEHFFRTVREQGLDPHSLTPEQQACVLREVEEYVIHSTLPKGEENSARNQVLLASLGRYAASVVAEMCEEFSHSRFTPAFFELSISTSDDALPDPVSFELPDGHRIYIRGTVDRVDTYTEGDRVYIRVVDYKTGVKKFSLADIEAGINLQLLLYLFSIVESDTPAFRERLGISPNGEILPAAVLYLSNLTRSPGASTPPTAEEAVALSKAGAERSGLIINDKSLIQAMDDTENKDYLPLTCLKGKDCEFDKNSLKSLTDMEALGKLKSKIGEILTELGTSLKSGFAAATPMKRAGKRTSTACEQCEYKSVCRNTSPDKHKKQTQKDAME